MADRTGARARRQRVEEARQRLNSSADMLREAWADLQSGAEEIKKAESLESALESARSLELDSELLERAREEIPFERIEEALDRVPTRVEEALERGPRRVEERATRVPRPETPAAPPRGPRRGGRRIDPSSFPEIPQLPDVRNFATVRRIARGIAIAIALFVGLGLVGLFGD